MNALIEKNKEALLAQRYCFPINQLMYATKEGRMKWADGKKVKDVFKAIHNLHICQGKKLKQT